MHDTLIQKSKESPHEFDLTKAIHQVESEPKVILHVDVDCS